jgi:hypothetical protein
MQVPAGAGVQAQVSPAPHETPKLRSVQKRTIDKHSSVNRMFQSKPGLTHSPVFMSVSSRVACDGEVNMAYGQISTEASAMLQALSSEAHGYAMCGLPPVLHPAANENGIDVILRTRQRMVKKNVDELYGLARTEVKTSSTAIQVFASRGRPRFQAISALRMSASMTG